MHKHEMTPETRAAIAFAFQEAVADVLAEKSLAALAKTGLTQLVVAGGVGANGRLRNNLRQKADEIGATVFFPELEFCTDNGAMIAFAGAMRLRETGDRVKKNDLFTVNARWDLEMQRLSS
jgi:N6-L-threonylcarbamoyladenine synthase